MDNYRKKLDEMHAPESLITATINRIHEEEKRMEQESSSQSENGVQGKIPQGDVLTADDKVVSMEHGRKNRSKRNGRMGAIGLVAAAAVLFLVVGMNGADTGRMELVYNTVPETIVRSVFGETVVSDMDVDDFTEYLGVDIEHPVENAQLIKTELYMEYDGKKVISDEACAYYNIEGEQLMIRYSRTLDVIPDSLKAGVASDVDGIKVLAGVSENEKERVAAFERNQIRYFIMSNSMNQEEFEEFLRAFLANE